MLWRTSGSCLYRRLGANDLISLILQLAYRNMCWCWCWRWGWDALWWRSGCFGGGDMMLLICCLGRRRGWRTGRLDWCWRRGVVYRCWCRRGSLSHALLRRRRAWRRSRLLCRRRTLSSRGGRGLTGRSRCRRLWRSRRRGCSPAGRRFGSCLLAGDGRRNECGHGAMADVVR